MHTYIRAYVHTYIHMCIHTYTKKAKSQIASDLGLQNQIPVYLLHMEGSNRKSRGLGFL